MSIVDEIIQLNDAGELSPNDGRELLNDLTPEQLRDFATSELIDTELAKRRINYDEENALENARQTAAAQKIIPTKSIEAANRGVNTLGITRLAGDLLSGRPITGTYEDSVLAKDYNGKILGINGTASPNSEIRVFNRLNITQDPETGDEIFSLEKVGVPTEYLSPRGVEDLFKEYQRTTPYKNQTGRNYFNNFASEYYGQQALKLAGYRAPNPEERSIQQKSLKYKLNKGFITPKEYEEQSVMDTNRIIETGKGLIGAEIQGSPADYRYVDPQGRIIVGDMQNTSIQGNVPLNIFKQTKDIYQSDMKDINRNLKMKLADQYQARKGYSLDSALQKMMDDGQLPPLYQGRDKYGNVPRAGVRAGKVVSGLKNMGRFNKPDRFDEGPSQYQYDQILFALNSDGYAREQYGMIPDNLLLTDTSKLDEIIARSNLGKDNILKLNGNKIDAIVPVNTLVKGTRSGKALLEPQLMKQFRKPYRFM